MYGQMTAGSWIYIGTQGILQGTFATFAEVAQQHFGGSLQGTITLTGGLGGMGGARLSRLPVTEELRSASRSTSGGPNVDATIDISTKSPTTSMTRCVGAKLPRRKVAHSRLPSWRTVPMCSPSWSRVSGFLDIVTDQTSAHDALNGYVPNDMSL